MAKSATLSVPFPVSKTPDSALLSQVCGWADEGEIERAGLEVERQLRAGRYCSEILMIWLAFRFARDGLAALPAIVRDVEIQARAGELDVESTSSAWARGLEWLTDNLRIRLKFHAKFQDATWRLWSAQISPRLDSDLAEALTPLLGSDTEQSVARQSLLAAFAGRIEHLYRKTFGALIEEFRARAPEFEPPPSEDEPLAQAEQAKSEAQAYHDEACSPQPAFAAAGRASPIWGSAALEALRVKLAAFERLIAEQAWPVAAMVARDVEHELGQFDPVRYFPELFSGYLRTLSEVGAELEQYMHPTGSLESQALERLYRANPGEFLSKLQRREASSA
jgi:hypothetical protein